MNLPLTPIRFLCYAEQQYPQAEAVGCGDDRFTYAQFAERVGRLAGALRQAGFGGGDRVAFLSGNCQRLLEAYYGVLEAAAVLLPLNVRLAPQELAYILIVDRMKDIIVSGGENISSLEVERVLTAHPAVLELAVIPVPDDRWGEVPKALVVLKPGDRATEAELIEFCRARLAHYKCPRSIEFLDSPLPRTGTGKVLKRELRKKYWPGRETIRPETVEVKGKGGPS